MTNQDVNAGDTICPVFETKQESSELLMIAMSDTQITDLLRLAGDRSEFGRKQLAETMADMFVREDMTLSDREQDLINEIIDELLVNSNITLRVGLSEKLCHSTRVPRRLLISLACDHIDVARPVLTNSEILTDEDLVYVVTSQDTDHARAIAERKAISEAVADALVTTGDIQVMAVVAENLGAKLSPKAMTIMTEAARFAAVLRQPVMQRPEVTKETATRLYWWMGA